MKCNSQISYTKGYFINNSNQKVNCLIKNVDWRNNPLGFEYKTTKLAENRTQTIKSVKEFGINNASKYVRVNVNIDRSSNNVKYLNGDKNPIFKKEELFLKVLIEGDANLLLYKDKNLTRYFYKTTNKDIEQLIFKEYKTKLSYKIGTNNEFRRQLFNNLKCNNISMNDVKDIAYKKKALLNFFTKYNNCINSKYINYDKKVKRDLFNLSIRPGLNVSSLSLRNAGSSIRNIDYNSELALRLGLEFEYILGFNNNKWAIIIEPTYQSFKTEETGDTNLNTTNVDYQSFELPVGVRHYLFLNDWSKFFINGSLIYDFAINSKVRYLDASSGINFAFGLGYNYKKTYSVEFRYHTNRDLLTNYVSWNSNYRTVSIIFGYSIF